MLGDGGYLLALENRGYVQAGPFTPEVTIEHPNALRALHEEFLHAGAEVLQVLTFYASENKLAQIGYAGRLEEINRAAVNIAREAAGADIVGVNCWQDPDRMLPVVEEMRSAVGCYVAAQPVAYRCTPEIPFFTGQPGFPDRLDPYQITRYEMGEFAKKALDLGVNYIGGCCGCEGSHIRQMARALGKVPSEEREWAVDYEHPQSATEAYEAVREGAKRAG